MTVYIESRINDTYDIVLPDFRNTFHADRPNWERGRLENCHALMRPGMVVYDIGAEHGDFTTLYRQWVEPNGTVIPVEPAAHYWPYLRGTYEANGFVCPPHSWVALVGDKTSRGLLGHVEGSWPNEAYGEGIPDGGFLHLAQDAKSPHITIDHMATFIEPDAIVMDIEGAEGMALKGAIRTMEKHRPLVWVSFHEETAWNWYRIRWTDIERIAEEVEYDVIGLPHFGEGETFFLLAPR